MTARPPRARLTAGILPALFAALLAASPSAGAVSGNWPPDVSSLRLPEEIALPPEGPDQEALRASHAGIGAFLGIHPGWKATVDPHAGGVDRAFGAGIPVGRGGTLRSRGSEFLFRHPGIFGPGVGGPDATLVFDEVASGPLGSTGAAIIRYRLTKDGLPVIGAGLTLGLRGDRLVLITTRALAPVTTPSRPALDPPAALDAVRRYVADAGAADDLVTRREPSLAFYPRIETHGAAARLVHHLVWRVEVKPEEAPAYEWHVAWVDARDGRIHALFPEAQTAGSCSPDPASAMASVRGGVRADTALDAETVVNLPYARVTVDGTIVVADRNGRYPFTGGDVSGTLDGEYFRVHCDNCTQPIEPMAPGDESGDVDFGTGGGSSNVPIFGNGTSTPADRSTYFHLNTARMLLGKWDNAFFDEIDAFVNIQDTCNAFSMSYMLGFFVGGGGCRNTGEIRGVVWHELGHTWDRFDGNEITNGGMSEWKGDALAMLARGSSCVARSFRVSGGPTSTCDGVRDIDEKAPGRTDLPSTPAVCPTCATLTRMSNPCGTSVHCLGQISGQASWHLYQALRSGADYISGAALPTGNPAFSEEQARWLMERLLVGGGAPMETWNPVATGLSVYDAVTLIDDDDADLANGTPHAAYINNAFSHHGIAETPSIVDSANCAPLADPVVSASFEIDPESALPAVRLEWTPAGGATTFDVYRNRAIGDAFLPLAMDVPAGLFLDTGVEVGATYRYFVAAVNRVGCAGVSPGAGIVEVTVDPPALRVTGRSLAEVPGAADGDGLIEPGEVIAVSLTISEQGGAAAATGVTAMIVSASAASPVVSGGPVTFGTVPAGGAAAGAVPFEVMVGPSEACGGRVHVVVSIEGNEGCWQDGFDIPIEASAPCAASPSALVEVVPGSLHVASGSGDADGIPDNCETTTVGYTIRNSGTAPSGAASAMVTSLHPGVTFAPVPACEVAGLDGGSSTTCSFTFSLGGTAPDEIPFVITTDSAGNPAPATFVAMVPVEADPPVFTTRTFGFDASIEGWTGSQFDVSTARFSSGTASAHSGSTTQPDICGRLTSPPWLLDPAGGSALSFQLYAAIEPLTDQWYDRANVHLIELDTGRHVLLTPSSGPAYNATGTEQGGLCHIPGQAGWGGSLGGFSPVSFDLSAWAGRRVRLEINYNTDPGDDREGIYVDDLSVTRAAAAAPPPDLQGDACAVPEVSAPAAPVPFEVSPMPGDIYRFRWEDLGAGLQYNLYAGTLGAYFSHGTGALSCADVGAGISCDGTACALEEPAAALPAGDLYFLVTGTAFGVEGSAGLASDLSERDASQSTCFP